MNTKPFDLHAALTGAKVVTRDGKPVRVWLGRYEQGIDPTNRTPDFVAVSGYDGDYAEIGQNLFMLTDEQGNYVYKQHNNNENNSF